jgi:ATP-dependent Lhr-like helicase
VVVGPLLRGSAEELFCDARNLESLLRLGRARAAVTGEPVPLERLSWILACRQGLVRPPKSGAEAVVSTLETLACLSLPAELWEQEVLPARVPGYDPHWLDRALFDAGMSWVGRPDRRLAFLLEGDLALLAASPESTTTPSLVPTAGARYTFRDLQSQHHLPADQLAKGLWEEAWQGRTANDGFAALRGAQTVGFRFPTFDPGVHRGRRGRRPEAPGCFAGHWYRVETNTGGEGDAVDREELSRDRVRLLLDRYGVLCRPLLEREEPALRWSSLFRSIRLMELSGELISGTFLADLPGPQFTIPALLPLLSTDQAEEVFWLSAVDPASLCGVDLPLPVRLPRRTTTTHLVYRGWSLALVSRRYGRVLEITLPPDHPDLGKCCGVLQHLLSRPLRPLRRICVEEINGAPATTSPYLSVLRAGFDTWVEGEEVILHRKRPGGPVAR